MIAPSPALQIVILGDPCHPEATFALPAGCGFAEEYVACQSPSQELFQTIATYVGRRAEVLRVRLAKSRLPREMSVTDIAEMDLLWRGARMLRRREVPMADLDCSEALAAQNNGGEAWLSRVRYIKAGPTVYRLEAEARAESAAETANYCSRIAMSLEVRQRSDQPYAEPLIDHQLPGTPFSFRAPSSWVGQVRQQAAGAVCCQLTAAGIDAVPEQIVVMVQPRHATRQTSGASPATIVREFTQSLTERGWHVGGAALVPTTSQGDCQGWVYAPRVLRHGEPMAVGATLYQRAESWVLVTVAGCCWDTCPPVWAATKRAAQLVRDSVLQGDQ